MGYVTPWGGRLLQLLEEGPRPREWLIHEVGGLVPPGHAWRARERKRTERHRSTVSATPNDESISVGRRIVVQQTISGHSRRGRVAVYWEDGVEMVRIVRPPMAPMSGPRKSAISRKAWLDMSEAKKGKVREHLAKLSRANAARRKKNA